MQTRLVVLQPTSYSNLDCTYCYLHARNVSNRMTLDTLSRIAEALFNERVLASQVTVVWHSGEPLAVPTAFYRNAFDCLARANRFGTRIRHAIQTNGTLINDEWALLFA